MKKRILFINGHLNAGGVERSLVDVLRHLDYEHFDVELMLLEDGGDYLKEIPTEVNTRIYHLNDASGPLLQSLWKLLREGKWQLFLFRIISTLCALGGNCWLSLARPIFPEARHTYDVVIAYRPERPTYFAAHLLKGKKKISWWHHGEVDLTTEQISATAKAYESIDKIVTVSEPCASIIKKVFPRISDKITVIPNMVCADNIKEKVQQYTVTFQAGICNIVSVGRLSPEKNMKLCVEAANALAGNGFEFHWYIIGDGAEKENIAKLIGKYALEDKVTLTGNQINPYPYIAKADILVHPSLVESQGLTPLEAMALDTPVIAVKSAGVQEYIRHGENGVLVNNNPEDLASVILRHNQVPKTGLPYTFSPKKITHQVTGLLG